MAGELTVPTTITTKTQFDDWVNNLSSDKLSTTQKDALKTDIASKLGLDMGNAITALGRDSIQADLNYFAQNPNATSIPKLDGELGGGRGGAPGQLDGLRAAANQFSDPFLIDLSAVLALMHETSEKLRSATKELREAENRNSQDQMQAAAEDIKASGEFQAIAGGLGAGLSIAGGAAGLKAAGGGLKSLQSLNEQVKVGLDDGPATPKPLDEVADLKAKLNEALPTVEANLAKLAPPPAAGDEVASLKNLLALDRPTVEANLAKLAPPPAAGDEVASLKNLLARDRPTVEANLAKLDPQAKQELKAEVAEIKGALAELDQALPKKMTREEFTAATREIELASQKWQSYGSMIDGLGKALGSGIQSLASGMDSAKAIHDKQASQAQFEEQSTNDLVKTLADFSQQIRQTVAAIMSAQDQAAQRVANV